MNLEFRHEIKGLWGYYETSEHCWCFDDDVLKTAFREFRKDKSSVLWVMDVSNEVDNRNLLHLSMNWETWEDYDSKIVTMTIWKNLNDREYRTMNWEHAKKKFREVIAKALKGDVVATDVFKPRKIY